MIEIYLRIKKPFRYLWLKNVQGFRPDVHCARCLIGPYSRLFGWKSDAVNRADRMVQGIVQGELSGDSPYLYLCGVTSRWTDNLHVAMVPDGESTIRLDHPYCEGLIQGVREVPIHSIPKVEEGEKGREFLTCRNYQFGWYYFPDSRDLAAR